MGVSDLRPKLADVIKGRIAERLKSCGVNPGAASAQEGLGAAAISDILSGRNKRPSAENLIPRRRTDVRVVSETHQNPQRSGESHS